MCAFPQSYIVSSTGALSEKLAVQEGFQAFVLCFISEFGDGATLLAANPDATTINIEDPSVSFKHQPRPPGSLGREEDEELLGNNDSDETEVWTNLPVSVPLHFSELRVHAFTHWVHAWCSARQW